MAGPLTFTVSHVEIDIRGTIIGPLTAEATATADGPVDIVLYWQDGSQVPDALRDLVPAGMVEAQIEDDWREVWAARNTPDPDWQRDMREDR